MHGPPADIESYPAGGRYDRTLDEGLGTTIAFPFERWRYRNLEGIGSNIIIEFVDQTFTGDFKLAYHPDDKDLMADKGFGGMKWAEIQGYTDRADRWLRHGRPMMDMSGAGDWLQVQKYFDRLRVTTATMGQTKGQVRRPEEVREDPCLLCPTPLPAQERPVGAEWRGSSGAADAGSAQEGAQLRTWRRGHRHRHRHAGPVWGW